MLVWNNKSEVVPHAQMQGQLSDPIIHVMLRKKAMHLDSLRDKKEDGAHEQKMYSQSCHQ